MKRLAWLVLALVVTFLGTSLADRCADGAEEDCPPACHVSCVDGCAVAPIATAPAPIVVALRTEAGASEPRTSVLELEFPTDRIPPRA